MSSGRAIWAYGVAAALYLAIAPAAPAQDAEPVTMTEARAEAALADAQEALAEPAAGASSRELTLILARLSQALPSLDRADRRQANGILARPDDAEADRFGDGYEEPEAAESPACDANFCVHWVATGEDAPTPADADENDIPDFVDDVLESAEDSRSVENETLGWTEPEPDGIRGEGVPPGLNRTDAYLVETHGAYFGYASSDENQQGEVAKQAYLVLDNDFVEFVGPELSAVEAMQVTMAHEYNHVLQFAYDSFADRWMFEATATWVEDLVYPEIDDYLNFVPAFAETSRVSLTTDSAPRKYGAAVWNHFLSESGDPSVVRDAWEVSPEVTPEHLSAAAYDEALGGDGASPFPALAAEFIDFAASTAEWQGSPELYPDAASQPKVDRSGKLRPVGARRLELNHLAHALYRVPARFAEQGLRLKGTGPAATHYGFGLIGRRGDRTSGDLETRVVEMEAGGAGKAKLPGDDYRRVTALIVNADARVDPGGSYRRDDQPFRLKLRERD